MASLLRANPFKLFDPNSIKIPESIVPVLEAEDGPITSENG